MKRILMVICAVVGTFAISLTSFAANISHPKTYTFTWNVWSSSYKSATLEKLYTLSSSYYNVTSGNKSAYGISAQAVYDNWLFFSDYEIVYLKNGNTYSFDVMGDNYVFVCDTLHLDVSKNGSVIYSVGRQSVSDIDKEAWRFIPLIYFDGDILYYSWFYVDTLSYNGSDTLDTGEYVVSTTSSPVIKYVCDTYAEKNDEVRPALYYPRIGLTGSGTPEAPTPTGEAPTPSGEAPSTTAVTPPYDGWEDDKNTVTGAFDFLKNAGNGLSSFFSAVFSFLPAPVIGLIAAAVVLIIVIGLVKSLL